MKVKLAIAIILTWVVMALTPPQTAYAQQQQQQAQRGEAVSRSPVLNRREQTGNGSSSSNSGSDSAEKRERRVIATEAESSTTRPTAAPTAEAAVSPSSESDKSQEATPAVATSTTSDPLTTEARANRREQPSEEEAAVLPYYNNFMTTYRLGPEDVIAITVFGHERYSKGAIQVPPDGEIAHPLIPEGIFVVGKTTKQVRDEVAKRLDEYIIDPKVSVSLEQARSARYSVIGDVGQPGVKPMTRRLTLYEAITEAGGVLRTGDKKKVTVLRRQAGGNMNLIKVDIAAIEKGKNPDAFYLVPGDQVVVPGNKFKKVQDVLGFASVLSFAGIFAGIF